MPHPTCGDWWKTLWLPPYHSKHAEIYYAMSASPISLLAERDCYCRLLLYVWMDGNRSSWLDNTWSNRLFIVWGIDITELTFDDWFSNQILLRRIRNRYRPITISNTSTCATELHKYEWIIWHAKEKQEKLAYFTTDWIWHITLHLKCEAFVNIFTKFVVRLVFSFSTFSKYKFSIYIF